jgi:hypothetical protein
MHRRGPEPGAIWRSHKPGPACRPAQRAVGERQRQGRLRARGRGQRISAIWKVLVRFDENKCVSFDALQLCRERL